MSPDPSLDTRRFGTPTNGPRVEAGNLTLRDRKNDMIVTGGENVHSIEVENALAEHPGVAQVVVVGVPDDTWGERITAAVVRRPGNELDEAALVLHARDRIARYKVPKQIVFMDALPTTASGKVRKDLIRRDLALEATR
ncbi:AMP-binding enzyme [Curtobacterium sp. Leaf261]|uniref:AMP-binding enzyme n=1 Tax=Curtobacterium sp. Leaf261 TaxID=1736311 RepID=UPI0009EB6B8C|nr:hypothetical protein [Curtobacterium sp. Leaf261]